jgi:phosphoglycolate phosphatase
LAYASSKLLLAHLAQFQLPVFLATNKRKVPTDRIIDMLEWRTFFKEIYSLDSVEPVATSKADLILHILSTYGLSPMTTLYVGDRIDDAEAATKAEVNFFHATWGYEQAIEATTLFGGSPQKLMEFLSRSGFSAANCAPFIAPSN